MNAGRDNPGTSLAALYRDTIRTHASQPTGFRAAIDATHRHEEYNPQCGDRIEVQLQVNAERIEAAAFDGEACAICLASASILCGLAPGRAAADLGRLGDELRAALDRNDPAPDAHALDPLLQPLLGVRPYPSRVQCATLPWHAAQRALGDTPGTDILREEIATRLLGPVPHGRRSRIMVTLPDAIGENPALLRQLLEGGMNVLRVNCAYGAQDDWRAVIDLLRRTLVAGNHEARLFMDLRGPKLRTGPMALQPAVLKIRPLRAASGEVLRPARVWLTASPHPAPGDGATDALLHVDAAFIGALYQGACVRLKDARGSGRKWRITQVAPRGCCAEVRKTTYLRNGAVLRVAGENGGDEVRTVIDSLPPCETTCRVRCGDVLFLDDGDGPGRPAVHDPEGRLLDPGVLTLPVDAVYRNVRAGQPIAFDDGRITGVIETVSDRRLRVRIGHTRRPVERLAGGKGVNLPETELDLPALGGDDLEDLAFVARNADIVGLSFTNKAADVRDLFRRLRELGREDVGVVLKIETLRGCRNLPEILREAANWPACGVLVARGDLAAECGFERLAELQEDILLQCRAAHVPAIVATGILNEMARRGHPTRAEITDAALAAQAECVMLGKGARILDALHMLDGILSRARQRQIRQLGSE